MAPEISPVLLEHNDLQAMLKWRISEDIMRIQVNSSAKLQGFFNLG